MRKRSDSSILRLVICNHFLHLLPMLNYFRNLYFLLKMEFNVNCNQNLSIIMTFKNSIQCNKQHRSYGLKMKNFTVALQLKWSFLSYPLFLWMVEIFSATIFVVTQQCEIPLRVALCVWCSAIFHTNHCYNDKCQNSFVKLSKHHL